MPIPGGFATLVDLPKVSPNRRSVVALFSFHPLLVSEFQRLLPAEGFRLLSVRLEPSRMPASSELRLPRASIYVVEAHAQVHATENLVGAIMGRSRKARILIVAEKLLENPSFSLLRLGVKGLLKYSEVDAHLARSLKEVARGGFWVPRNLLSRFVDSTLETRSVSKRFEHAAHLSRREKEVVELLLENLSNKEIASRLHMSERTAKFHVSNLLSKFGVKRRADLILLCYAEPA